MPAVSFATRCPECGVGSTKLDEMQGVVARQCRNGHKFHVTAVNGAVFVCKDEGRWVSEAGDVFQYVGEMGKGGHWERVIEDCPTCGKPYERHPLIGVMTCFLHPSKAERALS